MSESEKQPAFPLMSSLAATGATGALLFGLAWLGLPVLWPDEVAVHAAAIVAFGAAGLLSMVSLLVIAIVSPMGLMPVVYAHFGGAALRMLGCLAVAWLAIGTGRAPAEPLAAALGLAYVPLLFVEVAFVCRFLWQQDAVTGVSA